MQDPRYEALEERVRQLEQQHTEPMKVTRVELASADVLNQLKVLEQGQSRLETSLENHTEFLRELDQKAELHTKAFVRFETIQKAHTDTISGLQADVKNIQATQSDHGEMLKQILARLPEKGEG